MDPLLVITNRDAGADQADALEAALTVLRARASVEVCATADPGELDGALHRAGSRPIVVAGGDGSIHAVVRALYRRRELEAAVLGVLPFGTGNDFARANNIPLDPVEAADVVLTGRREPMDLIVDEVGQIVVNHVHAGAGAQASRLGAFWKQRLHDIGVGWLNLGRLGYPIGAAIAAIDPPFVRLHVEVDGVVVNDYDRPVLMVAVGNGAYVGGGTALTPRAEPDNGTVDVMISRAIGPVARVGYVASLVLRRHTERDDVVYLRGSTVSIAGEDFWCSADGEVYGPERRRTWRVEPAAYRLIRPEDDAR